MTWYAIRTESQKERTARRLLKRRNVETYLPAKVLIRRRHGGARAKRIVPLILGYVFVKAPADDAILALWMHQVRETKHVWDFVSVTSDKSPSSIADKKIDRLRDTISDEIAADKSAKRERKLKVGVKVRIKDGALAGAVGELKHLKGNKARLWSWLFSREITTRLENLEAA